MAPPQTYPLRYDYPFTQEEFDAAYEQWGCNCGPSALAFALQKPLDFVRPLIPDFDDRHYTNPSMMHAALVAAGMIYAVAPSDRVFMFSESSIALVRIQWGGPWTKPGVNPKWAYRQTHWIATFKNRNLDVVFDCNAGLVDFGKWQSETVPFIVKHVPRADGSWFPTHIWEMKGQVTK